MPHVRESCLAAVASQLAAMTSSPTIVRLRDRPWHDADLPAIAVYASADVANYADGKLGAVPMHQLETHVEIFTKGDDETALNALAAEAETALYADQTLGGVAQGIEIAGAEIRLDGAGDEVLLVADLTYVIFYRAAEGAPTVAV